MCIINLYSYSRHSTIIGIDSNIVIYNFFSGVDIQFFTI